MAGNSSDCVSLLVGWQFRSSQANPLENAYIVANHTRLAYDSACAVVDREMMTDRCARMDVNTGFRMGHFCDHAGVEGHLQLIERMGDPIIADCSETRIAKDDLSRILRGGIVVEHGLRIGRQQATQRRQAADKRLGNLFCLCFSRLGGDCLRSIREALSCIDLFGKSSEQLFDRYACVKTNRLAGDTRLTVIPGE